YQEFEWGASFDQLESDGMNGERLDNGLTVATAAHIRRPSGASAGWRRGASWVRGDLRYAEDERGFPGPFGSNPIGAYEGIDDGPGGSKPPPLRVGGVRTPRW